MSGCIIFKVVILEEYPCSSRAKVTGLLVRYVSPIRMAEVCKLLGTIRLVCLSMLLLTEVKGQRV